MTLLSSPSQVILALAVALSEATQYRRHELPGGVAGFLTAGSVMSLVMGLVFGLLAAAGAFRCSARGDQVK